MLFYYAAHNANRFNSRAREGRDSYKELNVNKKLVSIHAPARGATPINLKVDNKLPVSIHAPARGATVWWFIYLFL